MDDLRKSREEFIHINAGAGQCFLDEEFVQIRIDFQPILFYPAHRQLHDLTLKFERPQSLTLSFPVNPARMRRIISKKAQINRVRLAAGHWQ